MKNLPYLLFFMFLLFSCTENQLDDIPDKKSTGSYFDMAEADYIGIKKTDAVTSTWSNLYKYNANDGKMIQEKVGLIDDTGIPVDTSLISIQVNGMIPVSETHVIYTGSFKFNANTVEPEYYNSILVRLTDGTFFNLEHIPVYDGLYNHKGYLPADEDGNRYFISMDGIYKLSNLNTEQPVVEGVLLNRQWEIMNFFVAPDGTLFFREYSTNTTKAKDSRGNIVSTNLILYNFFHNGAGQVLAFSEYGLNEISINQNGIDTSIIYDDLIIRESEFLYQSDENYFFFEKGTKASDYSVGLQFNELDISAYHVIFRNRENNPSLLCGIYQNTIWTCSKVSEASFISFNAYNLDEFQIENFFLDADTLLFNTPAGVDTVIQTKTSVASIIEPYYEIKVPDDLEIYEYSFVADGILFSGFDLKEGTNISAIIDKEGDLMILERTPLSSEMEILEKIN